MANLGFSLRSVFGLLPKTEKIESVQNALKEEYEKLNSYAQSDELKEYNELKELVNSDDFKANKSQIQALDFKKSEEFQKESQFTKLNKNKGIVNYYKVKDSSQLSEFQATEESEELKSYLDLKEYLDSEAHATFISEMNQNLVDEKAKQKELKALSKSKSIKDYYKALNSAQLKNYESLNNSAELEEYNELQELVNSNKLQELKSSLEAQQKQEEDKSKIAELDYKNTEEYKKEQKFKQFQKDKRFKTYFKFIESPLFKHYSSFKDSDELKKYEALKEYVESPAYNEALSQFTYKNSDEYKKELTFADLKKSSKITTWEKYQKSKAYKLYMEIEGSEVLKEYEELKEFVNSDNFKEFKEYMLDKDKWKKTDDFNQETRLQELEKSADVKWYFATKDSNKFDELNSWNLTFEDDFTSGKVEDEKWMNSFFWGKMMLKDRYVMADDKQYYTDNKNFEINGTTLKIITKKEQSKGKVWHPQHGFFDQEFDYTSGMLSTAHSFRQKYGRIEAKIKLNAEFPVYQAFWLKGEKILPTVDVFRFNMDKKNRFQMSTFWGDPLKASEAQKSIDKMNGSSFTKDYYIYTLDWEENKLTWKINGIEVFSTNQGVPDEALYLMFSAGLQQDPSQELQENAFEIDWVRCYEKV